MGRKHIEYFALGAFGNRITPPEGDTASNVHRASIGQNFLKSICADFMQTVERVQKDNRLTEDGRRDTIQRKAQQLLDKLKAEIGKFISPVAMEFDRLRNDMSARALKRPGDATEAVERLAIRQHLAGLPTKDRAEVFKQALADNDEVVLGTFFEKPNLFKLLDPAYIEASKRDYLRKAAPQTVALQEAGAVLEYDIMAVVNDISLFCGPEANDTVQSIVKAVPQPGWSFEPNGDLKAIQHSVGPSALPAPIMSSLADRAALDSAQ